MSTFEDNLYQSKQNISDIKNSLLNSLDSIQTTGSLVESLSGLSVSDSLKNSLLNVKEHAKTQNSPVISTEGNISLHEDGSYSVLNAQGKIVYGLDELAARSYSAYNQEDTIAKEAGASDNWLINRLRAIGQTTLDIGGGTVKSFAGNQTLNEAIQENNKDTYNNLYISPQDVEKYRLLKDTNTPIDVFTNELLNFDQTPQYKHLEKLEKEVSDNNLFRSSVDKVVKDYKEFIPVNRADQVAAKAAYDTISKNEGTWAGIKNALDNDLGVMFDQGIDSLPYMVAFTIGGPIAQTGILIQLSRNKAGELTEEFIAANNREPTNEEQFRLNAWAGVSTVAEKFGDMAAIKAIPLAKWGNVSKATQSMFSSLPKSVQLVVRPTAAVTAALSGEGLSGAITETADQMALSGKVTNPSEIAYGALSEAFGTPGGIAGMAGAKLASNVAVDTYKALKDPDASISQVKKSLINAAGRTTGAAKNIKNTVKAVKEGKNFLDPEVIKTNPEDAASFVTSTKFSDKNTQQEVAEAALAAMDIVGELKARGKEVEADQIEATIQKAAINRIQELKEDKTSVEDKIATINNTNRADNKTYDDSVSSITDHMLYNEDISIEQAQSILDNGDLTNRQRVQIENYISRKNLSEVTKDISGDLKDSSNIGLKDYQQGIGIALAAGNVSAAKKQLNQAHKWLETHRNKLDKDAQGIDIAKQVLNDSTTALPEGFTIEDGEYKGKPVKQLKYTLDSSSTALDGTSASVPRVINLTSGGIAAFENGVFKPSQETEQHLLGALDNFSDMISAYSGIAKPKPKSKPKPKKEDKEEEKDFSTKEEPTQKDEKEDEDSSSETAGKGKKKSAEGAIEPTKVSYADLGDKRIVDSINEDDILFNDDDSSLIDLNSIPPTKEEPVVVNKNNYEILPGVYANEVQQKVLNQLLDWSKLPPKDDASRIFVLEGRGGTGKTTIINKAISLMTDKESPLFTAATHKAALVLASQVGEAITIHSALGLTVDDRVDKLTLQDKKFIPVEEADLVIVDEVSMLNDDIFQYIENYPNQKFIFIGDPAQFNPIDDKTITIGGEKYKIYEDSPAFDAKYTHGKLSQRMRQQADSPIIQIGDFFARALDIYREMYLDGQINSNPGNKVLPDNPIDIDKRVTEYNEETGEGVIFTNNDKAAYSNFIEDYNKDPEGTRIITFNNETNNQPKSVKNILKKIRAILNPDHLDDFVENDIVMSYQRTIDTVAGESVGLHKTSEYTVLEASEVSEETLNADQLLEMVTNVKSLDRIRGSNAWTEAKKILNDILDGETFSFQELTLQEIGTTTKITQKVLTPESYGLLFFYGNGMSQAIRKGYATDKKVGNILYGMHKRVEMFVPQILFAYAINAHKAQGSTYNTVYVMEDNIRDNVFTNTGFMMRDVAPAYINKPGYHAMYVAVSRPKKKLVMVSPKNPSDGFNGNNAPATELTVGNKVTYTGNVQRLAKSNPHTIHRIDGDTIYISEGAGEFGVKASELQLITEKPSTTPEFDKLPSYQEGQKTLTYAGIGSRGTPKEVLDQMTAIAKILAEQGYTLNSGAAKGADTAFEEGAGNAKNIFKAADATDQTRAIAKEIHPNPSALKQYPLDLMARNTNQIFGTNLDSPVDFVLAWTPDGLTDGKNRTQKSGGTGQAIDMASRKGIPVINMADPNWADQLEQFLEKPSTPSNDTTDTLTKSPAEMVREFLGAVKLPETKGNISIEIATKIETQTDTGTTHIIARYLKNENKILVSSDLDLWKTTFLEKRWANPRTLRDGSKAEALPEDLFQDLQGLLDFVLEHEYQHSKLFQKEGESIGDYETRINNAAIEALKIGQNAPKPVFEGTPPPRVKIKNSTYEKLEVELPTQFADGTQGMDKVNVAKELNDINNRLDKLAQLYRLIRRGEC